MAGTHGSHELVMLVAAAVLTIGGGVILVRASLDRWLAPAAVVATPSGPTVDLGPSALRDPRFAGRLFAAGLSAAAASIHLGAGPDHMATMGDMGLAFYAAAIFQTGFAWAWLTSDGNRSLARIGVVANIAFIAIWLWSRTAGLPGMSFGVEPVGLADAITVAMEVVLVVLLLVALGGLPQRVSDRIPSATLPGIVTTSLVAGLGILALSTAIALVDLGQGHGHAGDMHAAAGDSHTTADDGH